MWSLITFTMTILYKKVPGIDVVVYSSFDVTQKPVMFIFAVNIEKGWILISIECDIRCYTSQRTDHINCLQPELLIFSHGWFSLLTEHNRTKSRQAYTTLSIFQVIIRKTWPGLYWVTFLESTILLASNRLPL